MLRIIAVAVCLTSPAFAQDWAPTGDAHDTLAGRVVDYHGVFEDAWQRFNESGATLYVAGPPSWGRWEGDGDRYCSQWPPNMDWTCYGLEVSADGTQVRWVDANGGSTVGTFRE